MDLFFSVTDKIDDIHIKDTLLGTVAQIRSDLKEHIGIQMHDGNFCKGNLYPHTSPTHRLWYFINNKLLTIHQFPQHASLL